jgi:hypothetical protein
MFEAQIDPQPTKKPPEQQCSEGFVVLVGRQGLEP